MSNDIGKVRGALKGSSEVVKPMPANMDFVWLRETRKFNFKRRRNRFNLAVDKIERLRRWPPRP